MHPDLQSGSLFITDEHYELYLKCFLVSFAFFVVYFFGSHTILSLVCSDFYTSWENASQVRIRAMSMNNLHHVIALAFCIYNIRHACDENSDFPVSHEQPLYRWIYDDQCFIQPYAGFGIVLCISLGYLVMDLGAIVFFYAEWTSLHKQIIAHHSLAITGFLLAFIGGYALPGIA